MNGKIITYPNPFGLTFKISGVKAKSVLGYKPKHDAFAILESQANDIISFNETHFKKVNFIPKKT